MNVRYIVNDVDAAIPFYTEIFGFTLDKHPAPGFALLHKGNLQLLLNRPGTGGAGQSMDDGRVPSPGGWNRFQIEVEDIAATVETLKRAGCRFRNEIVIGTGGSKFWPRTLPAIASSSSSLIADKAARVVNHAHDD